ncbi:MAG: DUF3179 domain-containing protein [Planctomycetota bacterium]|nr:DUF3179 domain-containing protein [Planctomycetota bacterium]
MDVSATERRDARLDLRSGGWALLLGLVLAAGAVALLLARARAGSAADAIALEPCLVQRDLLVKATSPEALPPLVDPALLGPDEAQATRLPQHGKYLVPDDRVVGVALGGEACAYPVRVLQWHEVVTHTLGGAPIAVTYAALTDSARAFDRRVDGEALDLAASGFVWSSNPLLFDRRPPAPDGARPSSLWSQLQGRAVAGPAAARGLSLTPVPCVLTTWSSWRAAHPTTRVIGPDPSRADRYRKDPYNAYAGSEVLRFPVAPLPPADAGLPHKAPTLVVGPPGRRVVYPVAWLVRAAGEAGVWRTTQDGVEVVFRPAADPPHAEVVLPPGRDDWEVVHAAWFAWYAQHPDDARLVDLPAAQPTR